MRPAFIVLHCFLAQGYNVINTSLEKDAIAMTDRYSPINPLALSVGFGAAALAGVALFMVPFGFSMFGMHGNGMMGGAGYGYAMGFGSSLFVGSCVIIASAVAGAVAATVYNSLLPKRISVDDRTAAIKPT